VALRCRRVVTDFFLASEELVKALRVRADANPVRRIRHCEVAIVMGNAMVLAVPGI